MGGEEYESNAEGLERSKTGVVFFSEMAVLMLGLCPVYGLDVASLYLGGGVPRFDANSSSMEK